MYPSFFIFISILSFYYGLTAQPLFFWLTINALFFALVYTLNKPNWFLKSYKGKINIFILILNLPWLIFTFIVWHIQRILSKENKLNHIAGTHIYIGRRLLGDELPQDINVVIDLTSEFNEPFFKNVVYINIPLLDAIAPSPKIFTIIDDLKDKIIGKSIFIHCAQGHGRTALFTSILLVKLGVSSSYCDAHKLILSSRPKATLSSSQERFLISANKNAEQDGMHP